MPTEILFVILSLCNVGQVAKISRTCKRLRGIGLEIAKRGYDGEGITVTTRNGEIATREPCEIINTLISREGKEAIEYVIKELGWLPSLENLYLACQCENTAIFSLILRAGDWSKASFDGLTVPKSHPLVVALTTGNGHAAKEIVRVGGSLKVWKPLQFDVIKEFAERCPKYVPWLLESGIFLNPPQIAFLSAFVCDEERPGKRQKRT